jgi:glycosyltransferase involved in cell wall biosynthesis
MARIAIVLNSSWNIYNFRLSLLNRLSVLGHKIIAIAPEDEYTKKIPYEFHHVPIKSRSTISPISDIIAFLTLLRIYKKVKPDIVLLYTIKPNIYGNFAAFLLGIKTISNIAGLGTLFINQSFITKLAKLLYRIALKVPKKIFFQNNEDMEMFIKDGIVSSSIADRIPGSGVDITRFFPNSGYERKKNKKKFVFLLFSRMLWDKGVGEYIEAAKLLLRKRNDVEFKLLGFLDFNNPNAISKEEMEKLTETEGIEYLGVSDKVEDFILDADCVVLPSYREGVPRSLLEAAAMAKPIIATDIPGCRDVVEDGFNGFLCKPRDYKDLFEKMEKMVKLDENGRKRLGNNGREKIKREFDQNIVIVKYEKVINELCSSKNKKY